MEREDIRVLIIDDDRSAFELYEKMLKTDKESFFDIKWADSLTNTLEIIKKSEPFNIILLDLNLPDSRGFGTYTKVKDYTKNAPIIILTGSDDEELAIRAVKEGAQDYIGKEKLDYGILLRAVNYAIERSRIQEVLRNSKDDLESEVRERTTELQAGKDKMQRVLGETIDSLASALEKRDPYTAGQQRRVAHLATAIARYVGLSEDAINGLYLASLVHDIGKIGVPVEILVKPTQLTDIEMSLVRDHSKIGYGILKDIEFPWPIAQIVLQHHEKIDGSGYPQGLSHDAILMESKILCVADIVEAMSSHRPYRSAIGIDGALEEISRNKGLLYEPAVVDACLELFKNNSFKFEQTNQPGPGNNKGDDRCLKGY